MREDCGKGEDDEDARKRDTNAVHHERGTEKTINGVNTILDLIGISQVLKRNLPTKWSLSQLLRKATSWIEFIYSLSEFPTLHQTQKINRTHTHSFLLGTLCRILSRPLLRRIRRIITHTHIQQMQGIPFLDSQRIGQAIGSAVLEIVFEVVELVGELVRDVVGFVGEPVSETTSLRWSRGCGGGGCGGFWIVGGVAEG